jgi:hypothetical protein
VAFIAELRGAFQAFVAGLEADCRGLVRHALDVATSAYAKPLLSLSGLCLDDGPPGGVGGDPHEALQNVPPAALPTQIVPDRCPLAAASSYKCRYAGCHIQQTVVLCIYMRLHALITRMIAGWFLEKQCRLSGRFCPAFLPSCKGSF